VAVADDVALKALRQGEHPERNVPVGAARTAAPCTARRCCRL
jgi:hypothetical protein